MKRFLTILSILGCSLFASAQCEVTISADSTGTGLSLTANTMNNIAVTFEWNTGETTQTINANPNTFDYCVTAVFADGCVATACFGDNPPPPDCGVEIQTVQNGAWLQAIASGTAPFTYEWNTGGTTASVPIGSTDTLVCVTIADATGCSALACVDIITTCDVYVYEQNNPAGTILVTSVYGNAPFTYNWSNGATTANITPDGFGTYCVTITDNTGCESDYCYEYSISVDCEVNIIADSTGSGDNVQLTAIAGNDGFPWSYIWSNGATTQDVIVSQTGNYCVTVTEANGCSSSDCFYLTSMACSVSILEELTPAGIISLVADAEGTTPIEYYWNTGETTSSIIPNGSGFYSVTINTGNTPNDTCSAYALYYFNNPNECSVTVYPIDSIQIGVPVNSLVAYTTGNGDFTYEWSTGETTEEIDISGDGTYCVTVTSSLGCVESDCFTYEYQACSADIDASGSTLTSMDLCAEAMGIAPFTYLWSTGETTECINTNVTGTYSLTVTDADGCIAEACCLTFQFIPPNYGLEGTIYTIDSINGGLNLEGWVYRIGINADDGTASLIDSTEIFMDPSGFAAYYDFGDVAAGTYIVKAALTEGSDDYETTLPTYHFNELTWGEANLITVPNTNGWPYHNISMMPGDNPGGPGGIYGSVIVGDGFVLDPIPNTSILLFDESENPMLHVLTDANGEFAFPSLPWGTYKVQIEIIGQESAWYWVTIGPDSPTAEGLVFEVSEFGIMTDISEVLEVASFQVFPNPVSEKLTINFNAKQNSAVQISLTSITGKTLLVENQQLNTGLNSIEMNVTDIPTGIYFLNIADGKDVVSQKIVKK